MQAQGPQARCSLLQIGSLLLWIMEILQVEVEGLLSIKQLVVDWRLEFPAHLDADVFNSAVARLCRIADFHLAVA